MTCSYSLRETAEGVIFFPKEVLTEDDGFCLHMQVTSRGRKANLMLILVILSPIILHTSKITNVVLKKINSPFLFSLQFKTPEECSLYKIVLGLSVEDRSPTKAYSFFFNLSTF